MGTSIADDISLTNSATSLSLHIWSLMQGENPNYSTASAIAIFILIVVLVLSIFIKLISKKLNKMAVAQ
jgi:ABC-type sugar transport system permease subunit